MRTIPNSKQIYKWSGTSRKFVAISAEHVISIWVTQVHSRDGRDRDPKYLFNYVMLQNIYTYYNGVDV